jgi:hypothetical protein
VALVALPAGGCGGTAPITLTMALRPPTPLLPTQFGVVLRDAGGTIVSGALGVVSIGDDFTASGGIAYPGLGTVGRTRPARRDLPTPEHVLRRR